MVCEDNHRQGISVTGGVDIKIVNSVLKDTKGTPPQAGIDWEPDWERLLNVSMTNCYITNNRVTGIDMNLYRPAWKGAKTIAATFDNCHVDSDDGVQGIALKINNVQDLEGSDGLITFNDCSFRNKTNYSTVSITDKSTLKATVIFNRCFLEQTDSKGSVISLGTSDVEIKNEMTFGGIELNDCTVNDKYNRNFMTFEDNSNTTRGIRDVKGSIIVNNPFGANYTLGAVAQNITLRVIENKSTPPSINITQPIVLQKIEQGKNFTVSATAADIDAGTSNGAGIQRVIFEIQYANDKVYTFEDSEAPYTFSVATATWQKGIYLVKAIAVSSNLFTKNISVVPFEIIGSNDLTNALFKTEKGYTSISIFPNPSKTELIISGTISARTSYEIINFEGKVLQADTIVGKVISIFNLKPGSYLIKFKTEAGETVQRFVKE